MTNIRRRLKKLEELFTDSTGLVPNSPKWFDYWRPKFHLYTIGELKEPILFPAEIIVDWIRSGGPKHEEP
jgi:hypothetical protein